jgi:predicted RNA-binding protein with PUA-like domain
VVRESYQDPTTEDTNWLVVDLKPVKKLKKTVTLEEIKSNDLLSNIGLIRQGRLSVMKVEKMEFDTIITLSK